MNAVLNLKSSNSSHFFSKPVTSKNQEHNDSISSILFDEKESKEASYSNINDSKKLLVAVPERMEHPPEKELETVKKSLSTHTHLNFKKFSPILLTNLKIFVRKLKNSVGIFDVKNLSALELRLLNDFAIYSNQKKEIDNEEIFCFKKGFLCAQAFISKAIINRINVPLIHPYNKFKLAWDVLNAFLTMFLLFYLPISVSFDLQGMLFVEKHIFFLMIVLDIFIEMNTMYYRYGLEVRERGKILMHYFSKYFLFDLLGVVSLIPLLYDSQSLFQMLFFTKILTLNNTSKKMMSRFQVIHRNQGIKALIELFFIIILIGHIAACGWHYIGMIKPQNLSGGESWIVHYGLEQQNWYVQYLNSFYWAIVTVMTVGYGDITPQNNIEKLYCLVTILLGCMIFPYTINSIGIIIQNIRKNKIKYKLKIK